MSSEAFPCSFAWALNSAVVWEGQINSCPSCHMGFNLYCLTSLLLLFFLQLNKGAKACKANKWGYFPIHQAAFSGAKKCMDIILKYGEYCFLHYIHMLLI